MSGKRKYAIAAAAGAILLLGCLAAVLLAWGNKNIITINGIPVEKDEIIMYIQDERADICSWFYRNYQADCNAEDFWEKEYEGIRQSDVVIILTPQGRGTHIELGMAIALNKIIYLCHHDDTYFKCDKNTSTFYWLPQVNQFIGNTQEIAEEVLKLQ